MLKKELKKSSRSSEGATAASVLTGSPEKQMDDLKKLEAAEDTENQDIDNVEDVDAAGEEVVDDPENPENGEEIPDDLDADLAGDDEEEFKDINEQVVVYLYRGFAEIGDNVKVFIEDTENEERDPELVKYLEEFMDGYADVMTAVKDLAKKYVTTVELFDPEEGEEVTDTEDEVEDVEEPSEEELEDEAEDREVVESYISANNLEHNIYENEVEIYASFKDDETANKFESELSKFKTAEVYRHDDIGEIHAFVRVK